MAGVPAKKFREVKQALERIGYREARQNGSHVIFTKGSSSLTVPSPNPRRVATGRVVVVAAGATELRLHRDDSAAVRSDQN